MEGLALCEAGRDGVVDGDMLAVEGHLPCHLRSHGARTSSRDLREAHVTPLEIELGRTHGIDMAMRASLMIRCRLVRIRCGFASRLRNRGTTLSTSHRQRSSKRVILGHACVRSAEPNPRVRE